MIEHILKGGIHPNGHKISDISSIKDFQVIEGDEFFIPFVQHIGSPASAVVKIGDEVERGQLLAECGAGLSSRIHSPVNGQVIDISQVYHPAIGQVSGCTIKAINNDTSNFKKLDGGSDLSDLARNAGIVGLGGAGFPAYIKLNPNKPIDTVIINGAECEPYLMCDHALMHAKYESILAGAQMIKEHVKAGACIIAVENNKKDCINLFKENSKKYNIDVVSLPTKYPQGGEKQLIYSILGRTVPSGRLPADIGVLLHNVATVYAIYEAAVFSKPLFERVVTISGEVENAANYKMPLGVPVERFLERTGNKYKKGHKVIFGGPMTGGSVASLDIPVIKTTGGVLLLKNQKRHNILPCIRCGKCSEVCVMGLVPRELEQNFLHNLVEQNVDDKIMSCIECGCCSYICPSGRLLAETIKAGKKKAAVFLANKKGNK